MSKEKSFKPKHAVRMVYREILPGDVRKIYARSNDAASGGGARDLRFNPFHEFEPVLSQMFPRYVRSGVFEGKFHWYVGNTVVTRNVRFHHPTNSRPNEGRIANVNRWFPYRVPSAEEGLVFFVLFQDGEGRLWPKIATERFLRAGEWPKMISSLILDCISKERDLRFAISGYADFSLGVRFCNGK